MPDDDRLEVPDFLRRAKGEPQAPWTPPAPQPNALKPRDPDAATAAFLENERQRKRIKARNARIRRELAKQPKPNLTGMRWDAMSNQWIPDPSAPPEQRSKAMSQFSKPQSVKSNARRSAIKLGVDPTKVVAAPGGGWYFPLPPDEAKERTKANKTLARAINEQEQKKFAKAEKAKRAAKKVKTPKAAKSKSEKTPRVTGANFDMVAKMLREPGGAAISSICKATKWLPHTARARISVNVSKLLGKGEVIQRRREDGESHYAIVKSKQLDLPGT